MAPIGNTGIDPSLTRWPASASYALNEWPGAINVGKAGALGSLCKACPSTSLGYGACSAPAFLRHRPA